MGHTTRQRFGFALVALALAALPACGGGGGGGSLADVEFVVLEINGPFAAGASHPFTIVGDFGALSGAAATVRFIVEEGEPFPAGVSPNDPGVSNVGTVNARITSPTTVEGMTPIARFCGEARIVAVVEIDLHGVGTQRSSEPIAVFEAPRVESVEPTTAPASDPVPLSLVTVDLDGLSGPVTVHWSAPTAVFDGGQALTTTTLGQIVSPTGIATLSPEARVCGPDVVAATIDRIEAAGGRCISGAGVTVAIEAPTVRALVNDAPAGEPRSGEAAFGAAAGERFVVEGAGFGPVGSQAIVTFEAADGTPFLGGTSASIDVVAQIVGTDRIQGRAPDAAVCGQDEIASTAIVAMPGGSCATVPGGVRFVAPTIDAVDDGNGGTDFSAAQAGTYRIKGEGFGPVGSLAFVTFRSQATGDGSEPFNGGIAASTTVGGLVLDATTIEGFTPTLLLCPSDSTSAGCHDLSVDVEVEVQFLGGACTMDPWGTITFHGPTIETFDGDDMTNAVDVPSTALLGSTDTEAFTIKGANFGPVGSSAIITFEDTSGGTPFGGQAKTTVVATIDDTETMTGRLPSITDPRLSSDLTVRLRVTLLNGSCGFCNAAVNFVAPPTIDDVEAAVAVAGVATPSFLTRCPSRLSIQGRNFDTAATHELLDDADGSALGTGELADPDVTSTSIEGLTPVASEAADVQARARVVNADLQFDEFTAGDFQFRVTGRFETVNASQRAGDHAGMECWIDPLDPKRLVVLSHERAGTTDGLVVLRSTDAGETFRATVIDNAVDGLGSVVRRDPRVAGDRFGHVYLCYVAETSPARIVLLQSDDAGDTFLAQETVASDGSGGLLDPFLAVGPNGDDTAEDAVYVGWTDTGTFTTGTSAIVVAGARVTALGVGIDAFGAPVQVSDLLVSAVLGAAAVDADGALMVVFHGDVLDQGSGPLTIYSDLDADGLFAAGAFGTDVIVASVNVGADESITPQSDGVTPGTQVAALRTGANAGRFVVCYADEAVDGSGDLDVFVRRSDDDGGTWSAATRVDGASGSRAQFLPALRADPATGKLACAWYDARADTTNGRKVEVYASVSSDGGATWRTATKLADAASDAQAMTSSRAYGPYLGLAFQDGCAFCAWADNGDAHDDNPDGKTKTDVAITRFQ